MAACEDNLYSTTPKMVTEQSEVLGIQSELPEEARKQLVMSFLQRTLPTNCLRRGEDKGLRRKSEALESSRCPKPCTPTPSRLQPLSAERKKELFRLDKKGHKYSDYLPLHELWTEYIKDALHLQGPGEKHDQVLGQRLLKADLHGSVLTVLRSRCPSYVGTTGIVLQETRNMFRLVTQQDRVKSIPKMNSVFSLSVEGFTFTIHGNHIQFKASERASKKFKTKNSVDL